MPRINLLASTRQISRLHHNQLFVQVTRPLLQTRAQPITATSAQQPQVSFITSFSTTATMTASDQPSSPKRSKKEDNEDHNTAPEYRANSESPPPPPQRPEKYDPDAISHSVKSENISDEWKHQAPYKIQEEGSFSPKYEASCHCGKVQFQLSREKPLDAKYCHCLTCQRLHGMFIFPTLAHHPKGFCP